MGFAKRKAPLLAALMVGCGFSAAASAEDYSGFGVNYEALLLVEDESGQVSSVEGSGVTTLLTDCINWSYSDSVDMLIIGDGTNANISSSVSYLESIEGTHGNISSSLDIATSSAQMPGGSISYGAQYERQGSDGPGVAQVFLEAGDQSISGGVEIRGGEFLPIQAYRLLIEQLKDGEEEIQIRMSALGTLSSMMPREGEELYAAYEVIDSPFEGLELPDTFDDVFAGDSWTLRELLPPAAGENDPQEVIFEIYESGAISFWMIEFMNAKIALKPNAAWMVPDPGCS